MKTETFETITLINGDCMEFLKQQPDKSFDLCIADPPYGINMASGHKHCKSNPKQTTVYKKADWDVKPSKEYFEEVQRVCKHYIIWGANYFTDLIDLTGHSWLVWNKQQIANANNFAMGELAVTNIKKPLQIYDFSYIHNKNNVSNGDPRKAQKYAKIHPCQKPAQLYRWLLKTYASEGDRILDTHLGSGTIAIAAHDYGFELTGIEIDKDYFEAAKKKLLEHQAQMKLFCNAQSPCALNSQNSHRNGSNFNDKYFLI